MRGLDIKMKQTLYILKHKISDEIVLSLYSYEGKTFEFFGSDMYWFRDEIEEKYNIIKRMSVKKLL